MSAYQRNRGAGFEREIAADLSADWGVKIKRNIGQARDGGDDITVPPFRIECKRRKGIAVYEWLDQCVKACNGDGDIPVVIAKADRREPIVVMRYSDFKKLAREEVAKEIMK